ASLTGSESFTLNDAARADLQQFVEGGGTLIIDAAGANPRFSKSIEDVLTTIWPDAAAQIETPIPATDPLYAGVTFPGHIFRSFARRHLTGDFTQPRIKTIKVKGRTAIYYSTEDIS